MPLIEVKNQLLLFYCLQGIVHRDVKPGNFLFSRKANKGCLIDFNLALVSRIHTHTLTNIL
ncbi:Probable cell division control protein 7 homolog 2, partial [Linum grandiflorum]